MCALMSLGHKDLQFLLGMRFSNRYLIMPKWGLFNALVLLNEHGYPHPPPPPFYSRIEVLI